MKTKLTITFTLLISLVSIILHYLNSEPIDTKYYANVSAALSMDQNSEKFDIADKVRIFNFPDDFGPHNNFQTEWWYYTGNLHDDKGKYFGYQLTIFRRAIKKQKPERDSDWGTNQIYFGHFAVTDVRNDKFYSFERYSREGVGLAGAQSKPYRVWIEDWQIVERNGYVNLSAKEGAVVININLKSLKPVVLQGNKGLSQKSESAGNASYYYSQTRLQSTGEIIINSIIYGVEGLSWLDREWSTSALDQNQIGWDWFSIQMNDDRELMLYQIRMKDGSISNYSSGSLIDRDGTVYQLKNNEFTINVLDDWKSTATKIEYPAEWNIEIPDYNIKLHVTPYINNQEHKHNFTYWEGAVKVNDGQKSSNGYVELVGYF